MLVGWIKSPTLGWFKAPGLGCSYNFSEAYKYSELEYEKLGGEEDGLTWVEAPNQPKQIDRRLLCLLST